MESYGLLFELSHPGRLNILHLLKDKPMRLSQLSKKLEVTTAEVSRHLDRLGKTRLIARDSENTYSITPFAALILSEVSKLDFLTKHIEYFLNHDLSIIPGHLHWYNLMAHGQLSKGTLETTSLIKDASVDARKYVHVISDQVMRGMVDIDCKKNKEGVVFKKIYPKGSELPAEYESRMGESFEIRTLQDIPLGLKINEKLAGVALRDSSEKVDYSEIMLGEDESFRKWVSALFDYYWERSKPIL